MTLHQELQKARNAHRKELTEKLRPMVYELGFLRG